jgi:hypothetical protein
MIHRIGRMFVILVENAESPAAVVHAPVAAAAHCATRFPKNL